MRFCLFVFCFNCCVFDVWWRCFWCCLGVKGFKNLYEISVSFLTFSLKVVGVFLLVLFVCGVLCLVLWSFSEYWSFGVFNVWCYRSGS